MTDWNELSIGPTPCEEDCEQLGPNYSAMKARKESREFIAQLRRHFGLEPEGAELMVRSNPHDFGDYLDVVCRYDTNNQEAVKYAFKVEAETPGEWDDKAKVALRSAGVLVKGDDEVPYDD